MRFSRSPGRVGAVSNGPRQRFELEIDPGSTPITGVLTKEGREPVEFAGWLGLATALERHLTTPGSGQERNR